MSVLPFTCIFLLAGITARSKYCTFFYCITEILLYCNKWQWRISSMNQHNLQLKGLILWLCEPDELCTRERWEERVEADTEREQLLQNSPFGNEAFLCSDPACEHSPFTLCSAQLQLRWYGLRSMSMSHIDKLPSKTHRNIMSAAPVAILSLSPLIS